MVDAFNGLDLLCLNEMRLFVVPFEIQETDFDFAAQRETSSVYAVVVYLFS